jgi:hypothetical protein
MNQVCPVCGSEYLGWVTKCVECGVALVAPGDAPDPTQLPEEQQVVYELGAWSLDAQAAVAEAMANSGVPHGWLGADLVVHVDHEADVDVIVEEIEAATGQATMYDPDNPGIDRLDLDHDGTEDEIVYDLDEWPQDEREELTRRLERGGVPYRWEDDDTLVIASRDEVLVETLLDQVEQHAPDADDLEGDGDDEVDGELLGELFLAADRLKDQPLDADGLAGLLAVLDEAEATKPPFGVNRSLWAGALGRAEAIAAVLTGSEASLAAANADDDDDDADDDADDADADDADADDADVAGGDALGSDDDDDAGGASDADDDRDDDRDDDQSPDAAASSGVLTPEGTLDPSRHATVTAMAADLRAILRPYV